MIRHHIENKKFLKFYARALFCGLLLNLGLSGLCATPSSAQKTQTEPLSIPRPPMPPNRERVLETLRTQIAEEQARQKEREVKIAAVQTALSDARKTLVSLADSLRENERALQDLEARLRSLEAEESGRIAQLEKDKIATAHLILALQRIRRVPPEALIARPGAPVDSARTTALLQGLLPRLHHQAETLRQDLIRLIDLKAAIAKDRSDVMAKGTTLAAQNKEIQTLLARRESLYRQLAQEHRTGEDRLKHIAAQARSISDLIARIAQERTAESRRPPARGRGTIPEKNAPQGDFPSAGKPRLPVTGTVRVRFGQTDDIGAVSEGLRILAPQGAQVVAPMGGIVRFAGSFRRFGQIVIIEHANGYHSLISGLERIDTSAGRSLLAGEPLGILHKAGAQNEQATLYYELRLKGRPVDPSKAFAEFG